jgi:hypothetical protein
VRDRDEASFDLSLARGGNAALHEQTMAPVFGIFEPADHRGSRANYLGRLPLIQPVFGSKLIPHASDFVRLLNNSTNVLAHR